MTCLQLYAKREVVGTSIAVLGNRTFRAYHADRRRCVGVLIMSEKVKQFFKIVDCTHIFYCFNKQWVDTNVLKTRKINKSRNKFLENKVA